MCRKRPGPRCSYEGVKRFTRAADHFRRIKELYDGEAERREGTVSPRRRAQLSNASRRLDAARRVYYATPQGQGALRTEITRIEGEIEGVARPTPGTPEADTYSKKTRALSTMKTRLTQGVERRRNSYADLALVGDERRLIRDESRNRGGEMGFHAHPMARSSREAYAETADAPTRLSLREWSDSDVANAQSWVESGADPGWRRNPRLAPPRRIGDTTDIGEAVSGEEPQVKYVRVNTPDGQVVEGRHSFHLTKNSEGQYVVSLRSTVASSWEDASPIDKTTQELGHVLKNRTIGYTEGASVVGSFSSKTEAKRQLAEAKRSLDYAGTTAKQGRALLIRRAGRTGSALQRRGIVVWHRYASEWTRQPNG